jgi:hypothetical protein
MIAALSCFISRLSAFHAALRRTAGAMLFLALVFPPPSHGQPAGPQPEKQVSNADILAKTNEYVSRLQELLRLYEQNEVAAAKQFELRNELFKSGLISREFLDKNQRAHAEAKSKVEDTRANLIAAGKMINEIQLAVEWEQLPANVLPEKETVIFFAGTSAWSLSEAAKVETYYVGHFGVSLPVSATGQTELHTRMGFDHREAVDIALHPDSTEGQNLIAYLKNEGYPFIAFRTAVPGSATGAHIHIGHPSVRILASVVQSGNVASRASF